MLDKEFKYYLEHQTELVPMYNGKYVMIGWDEHKAGEFDGPCSGSAGDVIASFDNPTKIWDELKINGVPIGEVLEKSLILALD